MLEQSQRNPGIVERLLTFGRMIKFSHSIFALPFAVVSAIVVVTMLEVTLTWVDVLLLLVCMVSARTAAMGFNRIADREIDALNPRTNRRELPSGKISTGEAWIFTGGATVVFIAASFGVNQLCGLLSFPLLTLLYGYSLTKRYTWASHFVLGACLGAAPIGVWFALTGSFHWAPILLGLGVTLWTAGFDIYYSLQDEEFDREKGLRSVPARFGKRNSLWIVRFVHLLAVAAYAGFGIAANLSLPFWFGLTAVTWILLYEAWLLRNGDLSKIDIAFFNLNGYVSILFAIAVVVDVML
ncbi:MAG: UbiA-like polyprenyltransferase [Candidatus Kapaibacterium sp.]